MKEKIFCFATGLVLGFAAISAFSQTSTRPESVLLYDGLRRADAVTYRTREACVLAARALVERKRVADPKKALISARCVGTTYVDNKPEKMVVVPPAPPPPAPPVVVPPPPPPVVSPGLGRLPANPRINEGFDDWRVNTDSPDVPGTSHDGTGSFRTRCTLSHYAFDDGIVYPGQPGRSHLHAFMGNTSSDAFITGQNIRSRGRSTCRGGTVNLSSYWIPALIDTATNLPIDFEESNVYYKSGYQGVPAEDIKNVPEGLVMLAGDANNTTPDPYTSVYKWKCHNMPYPSNRGPSIPASCPPGDQLELEIRFPQCWDGVNLDSPDHRSHMSYGNGQGCPASHPVALPEISFLVLWPVPAGGSTAGWRLSSDTYSGPAGYSAHGDFMAGWNPAIVDRFTRNCIVARRDCGSHILGGGWTIY